jgi:hypothetical protein
MKNKNAIVHYIVEKTAPEETTWNRSLSCNGEYQNVGDAEKQIKDWGVLICKYRIVRMTAIREVIKSVKP